MTQLTKDEAIKRIEALGGQYAPEMEPKFSIWDQLLVCETLAESYFGSQKGAEHMAADDWEKLEMEAGPTWDFENDKELQGVLTEKEEHVGPNDSMMYKVQTTDGDVIGVWGNTVLDGRLKRVEVGEEIKLVYLGKMKSPKTNREYHAFDVYHRPVPMAKVE